MVITIVSGLPRSGTSMMMRMLQAGGIPLLTDNIRKADQDNPKGYYEYERVKNIEHDQAWLEQAVGKAVKMATALLKHLPPRYNYSIIIMRRKIQEILASQQHMLIRRGKPTDTISDERMARLSRKHLEQVKAWLGKQPNIRVVEANYNEILKDPGEQAKRVSQFFGDTLDVESMARVVDPALYRQRSRQPEIMV